MSSRAGFSARPACSLARCSMPTLPRHCLVRLADYKQKDWDVNAIFYNCSMDEQSEQTLARLIRETRVAALSTLHDGGPNLAMVAYSFAEDFSVFYIYVSRLGKHTTDMENDPRVSLLITETDDRRADPQTLARASIRGTAEILPRTDPGYAQVKQNYLERFPEAEQLFSLGDFNFWKITPKGGRYVAGFGRAFNLVPEALVKVSTL
jgi:putative heme iron utilization protein